MNKYKNLSYAVRQSRTAKAKQVIDCLLDKTDINLTVLVYDNHIKTSSSINDLIMQIPFEYNEDTFLFQVLDIINDELTSYYQMMSDFEFQDHDVF